MLTEVTVKLNGTAIFFFRGHTVFFTGQGIQFEAGIPEFAIALNSKFTVNAGGIGITGSADRSQFGRAAPDGKFRCCFSTFCIGSFLRIYEGRGG